MDVLSYAILISDREQDHGKSVSTTWNTLTLRTCTSYVYVFTTFFVVLVDGTLYTGTQYTDCVTVEEYIAGTEDGALAR